MDAPQLPQSNVASIPPPSAGIGALQLPVSESTPLGAFTLPTPAQPPISRSPVPTLAAPPAPWRLPATVGPFLADSLRSRWESYRARLQGCQDDFSEETVHELRVATRRLIAQFVMLRCVLPDTTAEKARRVLKRQLKALGQLRDTHVQRLFMERHVAGFPHLLFVLDSLRRRERRLEKAAAAKVTAFSARKLGKLILSLSEHLASNSARASRSDRLAATVAQATADAFAHVVRRHQAIAPASPGTIHRTRVAFKKFRYMLESLSPDFTGLTKRDLRAMARYQRRMGLLQDLEVMHGCITAFVQKHKGMGASLRPFARHLQAKRARALRSFLKSADELFEFWPPGRAAANPHIAAAA
ncbi:MAG TPA: CHAD domain-containing protein [Candidatus Binatia bacterium]|jgi:CHAD domain-containing protein|nr:CHAD domain-containing protein [Candidatus Binatia bacterium]